MDCYCGRSHSFTIATALEALRAGPDRLAALTKGLARAALDRAGPERWSIREIVAHLRDVELMTTLRYRLILVEQVPNLPPMDQDRWAEQFHYRRQSVPAAVAGYRRLRTDNLTLLRKTTAADRQHEAWHPEHGTVTLEAIVIHMASHDARHFDQIAAARESE